MPNKIQNPDVKHLSFVLCHSIVIWALVFVIDVYFKYF